MARGGSLLQRVAHYVKWDLREIVAPRSLPDPPGIVRTRARVPLASWPKIVRESVRNYLDSFDRDRLEAQIKRSQGDAYVPPMDYAKERREWSEAMTDLGVAAKKGGSALLPKLQAMYTERVRSFKDAAGEFVAGYRDGYASEEAARKEAAGEKAEGTERAGAADQERKAEGRGMQGGEGPSPGPQGTEGSAGGPSPGPQRGTEGPSPGPQRGTEGPSPGPQGALGSALSAAPAKPAPPAPPSPSTDAK